MTRVSRKQQMSQRRKRTQRQQQKSQRQNKQRQRQQKNSQRQNKQRQNQQRRSRKTKSKKRRTNRNCTNGQMGGSPAYRLHQQEGFLSQTNPNARNLPLSQPGKIVSKPIYQVSH